MPTISEIPTANALQVQLDSLNRAIAALDFDGSVVSNITVIPGTDPNAMPGAFMMSIGLMLDPPISDPTVLDQIQAALQTQANAVQQQLVNMGYTDDTGTVLAQGPTPESQSAQSATQAPLPEGLPPTPNAPPEAA